MSVADAELVEPGSVSETLRCPICMDIFNDPVFFGGRPCQHVFCQKCLEHALEQSATCPSCRADLDEEDLQPHQAIRSLIDELLVRCSNRCGWTGRRDALSGHIEACPWTRLRAARARLAERDARIAELEAGIDLQAAELEAQDATLRLAERDARIAALEARAAAQDGDLADVATQLSRRQARIEALELRIAHQDARLVDACSRLSIRDGETADGLKPVSDAQSAVGSCVSSPVQPCLVYHQTSLEEMIAGTDLDM
eukprot:TRINITY_DN43349_c0_g1_i1.p1 TRINITY_DN43349_c0_g1~~TRINITY_DN43349_c0_g1_i1.p1  ORF type:complete len:256 (+),score=37.04 TRINITY_DN43349_c0_g1_i1:182-949(+)